MPSKKKPVPYVYRGQTRGPNARTRELLLAALEQGPGTVTELKARADLSRATITQAAKYMVGSGELAGWIDPLNARAGTIYGRPDQRPDGAVASRDELVLRVVGGVALTEAAIAERTGVPRDSIHDVLVRLLRKKLVTRSRGFYRAVTPPK
jgi:DNA-binding MarR family transcriptional regulator